ncbi:hypothetical protein J3F84DRAFT_377204 [Trichoderma pleuroticola]
MSLRMKRKISLADTMALLLGVARLSALFSGLEGRNIRYLVYITAMVGDQSESIRSQSAPLLFVYRVQFCSKFFRSTSALQLTLGATAVR